MNARVALLVGIALLSCSDPVHDAEVAALGPEVASVPPGPLHRPGQPCLTCHGGDGPATATFAVGGTIFKTADAREGIAGVVVTVVDSAAAGGVQKSATTNAAGNFIIGNSNFTPVFPLHDIKLEYPGLSTPQIMHTRVGREGSCGSCHFDTAGGSEAKDTPGHIYLVLEAGDLPAGGGP
jgi:hypothetical protein